MGADSHEYEGLSEEELAAIEADIDGADDEDGDAAGKDADADLDQDDDDDPDGDDKGSSDDGEDGSGDAGGSGSQDGADEDPDKDGAEGSEGDPGEGNGDAEAAGKAVSEEAGKAAAAEPTGGTADDGGSSRVDVDKVYDEKIYALDKRLDDGDIDFDSYKKELLSIERERTRAVVREEMAAATAEQTWKSEQEVFFSENGYLKNNKHVFNAFASEVNRLLEDKAWSNKPGSEILAEAKREIDSAFGIKPSGDGKDKKKADPADAAAKKAVQDAKKASAKTSAAPRTLRDVPSSESNNDAGGFAYLDKLEGAAYEAAIAKLSPEQLEAYANS